MRVLPDGALAAKDTLRTDLSISDEMVPSTRPWMALPSGCIAGSQENQASLLWQMVALLLWFYLGTRGFRKMLWGLPPIHFGREVPVYAFCGTLAAKVILMS